MGQVIYFNLYRTERNKICRKFKLHKLPFQSLPAIKIGKLAIHAEEMGKSYRKYLLWLSIGFAKQMNDYGIACRFLTVDADISHNKTVPQFYEKSGFVFNLYKHQNELANWKSMRYDLFQKKNLEP
ncbi:MAG TPA: hypothetical protein DDW65_01820 [Firmicutes bacterium]|nr:hypothetical protein [Bacillota bacterium]